MSSFEAITRGTNGGQRSSRAAAPARAPEGALTLGPSDDPAEREADAIADEIGAGEGARSRARTSRVAPYTSGRSEERSLPAEVSASIQRARGTGAPLSSATRADLEPRFGADFSGVRVHSDGAAGAMASDLHASAFTVGSDIFFAPGRYAPDSRPGQRLLAHELTHVVQAPAEPVVRRSILDDARDWVVGQLSPETVRFMRDLIASVREAPRHAGEILGEVWDSIVEHWVSFTLVLATFLAAEAAVGALTAVPEPTFLTKLAAFILQVLILAALAVFAVVELHQIYTHTVDWWRQVDAARGDPARISSASRAFCRVILHIALLVLSLIGVRARVRGVGASARGLRAPPPEPPPPPPPPPPPRPALRAVQGGGARRPPSSVSSTAVDGNNALAMNPEPAVPQPPPPRLVPPPEPEIVPIEPPAAPVVDAPTAAVGPQTSGTTSSVPGAAVATGTAVATSSQQQRPPFILRLPSQKAPHLQRYRAWLGVLQSDPSYQRGNPNQLHLWHQALRSGGSDPIGMDVYERGHQLGFTGAEGEERIRVPNWTWSGRMAMEVDHVIELQVTPPQMRSDFNSIANFELLDRTSNGSCGPQLRANIAAERAIQVAHDPSAATRVLFFDQVQLEGGASGERWSPDQLREGEQLDAYEAL